MCTESFVALRIKKALGIFRELITTSRSQSGFLGPGFRLQNIMQALTPKPWLRASDGWLTILTAG